MIGTAGSAASRLAAFAVDPAQHGIDEAAPRFDAGLERTVSETAAWAGVSQEEELRDAEPERVHGRRAARRHRTFEAVGDEPVDLPQPPQHGAEELPREGAVARAERGQARMRGQQLVERPAPAQHGAQQLMRHRARCAGRGRAIGMSRHGG